MEKATIEKNIHFERVCPFLNKSSNDNCYYKNLQSINVPYVLRYCCSEYFGNCPYYDSEFKKGVLYAINLESGTEN